jgi:hypothetical protein
MVKGNLVLAVLVSSFAIACSVTPAGQDLFAGSGSTPSPSPTPSPTPSPGPTPAPCAEDIGCGTSETAYATVTQCTSAGHDRCRLVRSECGSSSFYCGSGGGQCGATPSCDADDLEVVSCGSGADCYTRTLCGTTITCQRPYENCKALPTCDAGDPRVTDLDDCKLATSDCYTRTICGTTIWCNNVN